jgi:hypothetical protein
MSSRNGMMMRVAMILLTNAHRGYRSSEFIKSIINNEGGRSHITTVKVKRLQCLLYRKRHTPHFIAKIVKE